MLPFWNPLDPVGSFLDGIADTVKGWMINYMKWLQDYISATPDEPNAEIIGVSWGISDLLTHMVLVTVIVLFLVKKDRYRSTIHATFTWVTLTTAGYMWAGFLTKTGELEAKFNEWAKLISPGDPSTAITDSSLIFDNPIMAIVACGDIALGSHNVVGLYAGIDTLRVIVERGGLIAIALAPLGPRSKRLFHLMISAFFLSYLFARTAGTIALEVGFEVQQRMPNGTSIIGILTSMRISMFLIFVLVAVAAWISYQLPAAVAGLMEGRSQVSGEVESKLKDGEKVDVEVLRAEGSNIYQTPPVVVDENTPNKPATAGMTSVNSDEVHSTPTHGVEQNPSDHAQTTEGAQPASSAPPQATPRVTPATQMVDHREEGTHVGTTAREKPVHTDTL